MLNNALAIKKIAITNRNIANDLSKNSFILFMFKIKAHFINSNKQLF